METKQFVTMAVGLVIGVLLISGVVAPVIADVSNNSESGSGSAVYTNTGDVYYLSNTDSTSITYYSAGHSGYTIDTQDSVLYDDQVRIVSESWGLLEFFPGNYHSQNMFSVRTPDSKYQIHAGPLTVNGHTITFSDIDDPEETYTISDIVMCVHPSGDYVDVLSGDGSTRYALNTTPIICYSNSYLFSDWDQITVMGTISNSSVKYIEHFEQEFPTVSDTFRAPVTYTVIDDQLSSLSMICGLDDDDDEPEEISFKIDPDAEFDDSMQICILPIEVSESSGGSVSPTLVAMLSVIPLLLTVGLVIGAIAYMKRV